MVKKLIMTQKYTRYYKLDDVVGMIPRLMLGTSPFIGAGQFGVKSLAYRRTFYDKPENIRRLLVAASRFGIRAVQIIAYEPLIKAVEEAERVAGRFFKVITIVEDFKKDLERVSGLEPEYVAPHAMFCDRSDPRLQEWIEDIKETGAKPAASTHLPGITIPRLEHSGFEAYLAPLNPLGYLMEPDFNSALKAIVETSKPVIAIKPLAAGKLAPDSSLFEFIYKYADSMAVGMTSEKEIEEISMLKG
jgi:hypothetical protein